MILPKVKQLTKHLWHGVDFRFIHKMNSPMLDVKNAYFHYLEGSDKFNLRFLYVNEGINVNRQFNFERSIDETIQNFVARIKTNLEKIVSKKLNKKRKKSESETEYGECENIVVKFISHNNSAIQESASCKDVFFSQQQPNVLRIMETDYKVLINSPWIESMKLPTCIMAGFPVFTTCFETKFTDKSLSKFIWMKFLLNGHGQNPSTEGEEPSNQYIVVGEGFIYIPSVEDIGYKLMLECSPKNASSVGPSFRCQSTSIVDAGPGYCPFEERHLYTQEKTINGSFRVISYNILADTYASTDTAQNELFDYCPNYALSMDYRKQLILKELLGYNADLVCLQEVDMKVFEADLCPVLAEQGLIGVHSKKSNVNEGVATFYSSSKFKLIDVQEVVLSEELQNKNYCSDILASVDKNTQLKERITALGTTAQAVILSSVERPAELLVVGNTHLYFHPDSDHIRLLQGGIILAFLTDLVQQVAAKNPGQSVSLVCCGDFNSVPECGIYKLMTTKHVPSDFIDWKSKPEEEVKELSLSQPFNMDSACGTPPYTNYTVTFAGCLDYIFYQTDRLKVDSMVPLPSDDEMRVHRAIPSVVFPSDHVALVATLQWTT